MIRTVSIGDGLNEMKFGQVFVNGKMKTGFLKHRILGGLDLGNKHFWGVWDKKYDLDNAGTYNIYDKKRKAINPIIQFDRTLGIKDRSSLGSQITQKHTGLYIHDELGCLEDKIRLTLAGRYTFVKDNNYGSTITNEEHFSPRIGLSYSLDENTSAYALYDQTFTPTMGQLRNGDKAKSVTGNNKELGIKRAWFSGRWNTTISVYQILKNNETAADPENDQTIGESYVVHFGQSQSKGVEIDIVGEIIKGLSAIANYAYTDYKVTKSTNTARPVGMRLPGYAKHNINVWLKYDFTKGTLKGLNISAGQSSLLDRSTWGIAGEGQSSPPDYIRFDASTGWRHSNLNITLNVNNVFNRYLYSGSISGKTPNEAYYWQSEPKRNYKLGIAYSF